MSKPKLQFGCVREIPEGIETAWGARWIFPNDFVWDRQCVEGPEAKALESWLQAPTGNSHLRQAIMQAGVLAKNLMLASSDHDAVVLYEDDEGKIVGNPQGSYGYLYVCAWLKGKKQ
jgi:hypothetical protein